MPQAEIIQISQPDLDLLQMCSGELCNIAPSVGVTWSDPEPGISGGGFFFCEVAKNIAESICDLSQISKDQFNNACGQMKETGKITLSGSVFKISLSSSTAYMTDVLIIFGRGQELYAGCCVESTIPELMNRIRLLLVAQRGLESDIEKALATRGEAPEKITFRSPKVIGYLPFNDFDMAAVTDMVRRAKAHSAKADFDISRQSQGIVSVVVDNWRDNDGSLVIFEIHKIGKKRLLGHKTVWIVRLYTKAHSDAAPIEYGCTIDNRQVNAAHQAETDFTKGNVSIDEFELACAMAMGK